MSRFFTFLTLCLLFHGLSPWQAVAVAAPGDSLPADTEEAASEEKDAEKTDEQKPTEEPEPSSDESQPAPDDKPEEESKPDSDSEDDSKEKADEKKADEKDDKASEPHKVERKPLKIETKLSALFVASDTQEVALRPEAWSTFKVVEAVEHGTHVNKGDVLVRFDDEKIELKLADEMLDQQLGELAMMRLEEEFPRDKRLMELRYENARRRHEQLLEDYEHYKNIDRPFFVEVTNYRFQEAKESLASQKEELDQLEKMYDADELTEETEAIVLRRQRFEVETAELIMKLQTADRDYALKVQLPRRDQSYDTLLEEAELALQQSKTAKESGLTRSRYELEKKRDARARSVDRHSKLVSDRALMVLRAPTDGTVYYGRCVNGKWSEVASYTAKLKPFGNITANKVLMTLVNQRPLYVRAAITEKELPDFAVGQSVTLVPAGDTDLELPGEVTKVSSIPGSDKKFTAIVEVDTVSAPDWLVAGMTCKANVTIYENPSALVIPIKLVQTDEDDKKKKYVMLVDPEQDKPVRRDVKLGREKEKLVEVLKGLKEGDEIVKEEKEK